MGSRIKQEGFNIDSKEDAVWVFKFPESDVRNKVKEFLESLIGLFGSFDFVDDFSYDVTVFFGEYGAGSFIKKERRFELGLVGSENGDKFKETFIGKGDIQIYEFVIKPKIMISTGGVYDDLLTIFLSEEKGKYVLQILNHTDLWFTNSSYSDIDLDKKKQLAKDNAHIINSIVTGIRHLISKYSDYEFIAELPNPEQIINEGGVSLDE